MIEKITCRAQEQRRRPSGFSGKYYLKAVEIFHRKLSMSLTGEAERSYLRTYIFAVMEPGHVIVTGCRCRNSEVMPSAAAEGIRARPHPAPVMGKGSRRAGAAGERPEREGPEAHACLRAGRRHGRGRGSGEETGIPPSGLWILSTQKVPGFQSIAGKDFSARLKIRQS